MSAEHLSNQYARVLSRAGALGWPRVYVGGVRKWMTGRDRWLELIGAVGSQNWQPPAVDWKVLATILDFHELKNPPAVGSLL